MATEPHRTGSSYDGLWRVLSPVMPFVATTAASLAGIALGAAIGWFAKPAPRPITYPRTSSLPELVEVCEPLVAELETQLTAITGELELVLAQVALKDDEIAELEPKALAQGAAPSAVDGRSYVAELAAANAQRGEFVRQQQVLERIRNGLVDQHTRTRERLMVGDEQIAEQVAISDLLRDERGRLSDPSMLSTWFRVVGDSQLAICGVGTGRRSGDCRAAVAQELADVKPAFIHCVRTGQPVPEARQTKPGAEIPPFARLFDTTNDLVSGWYLSLCDPTVPLPATPPAPEPEPR